MAGAQLNKFIFSLTITSKIKLLLYNVLEIIDKLFKIHNLDKIIIFKKIANYAESLLWYNYSINLFGKYSIFVYRHLQAEFED